MFQANELVNLLLAVLLVPLTIVGVLRIGGRRHPAIMVGYVLVVSACVLTVAEGLIWADALDLLEHFALASAGVAYAIGFYRFRTAAVRDSL